MKALENILDELISKCNKILYSPTVKDISEYHSRLLLWLSKLNNYNEMRCYKLDIEEIIKKINDIYPHSM